MHTKAVSARSVAPLLLIMAGSTLMAADEGRVLFDFGKPDAAKQWQAVNDGVLGGLSDGQFKVSNEKTMEFFGTLSLKHDGGFASVRSMSKEFKVKPASDVAYRNVSCEGTYPHHLQGICVDEEAVYWSFTTQLLKTDLRGKVLRKVLVANHHGDLCFHDGKLNVAVNLGKFNDPEGNADSWIYTYDADDLSLVTKHETQEVFHGAGGIGFMNDHFFVVGGLPNGVEENYVYEYDGEFQFMKKHVIKSGHTHLGIQTGTFADDHWWFGCYGDPKILLVTDAEFNMKGRYEFDCSFGIVGLPDGRLLSASGRCDKENGCTGAVRLVVPNEKSGFEFCEKE